MINLPELFLPATRGARSGRGWLVRLGRTHQWWLVLRLPRASLSFLCEILGLTRNWVVGPGPWAAAMAIQIVEYDLADTFEPFPHEFNLVGLGARIACHPFRVCHTWVRRDPLVQSWLVGHLPGQHCFVVGPTTHHLARLSGAARWLVGLAKIPGNTAC